MRKLYLLLITLLFLSNAKGQNLTGPNGYKVVDLGNNGQGDYTHSLILLHEVYNGTLLPFNNAVGTITAYRGTTASYNRVSVANINTTSAYNGISGSIQSSFNDAPWRLKTCTYNGKKYIAVDVPYSDAYHDWGFRFEGWNNSSGESLKCVNYLVSNQPMNQDKLSDIQDFNSNIIETHAVQQINILGNLNVGTETYNPDYLFQVKGKIRAQEIKVETANWPDYVFKDDYKLHPLKKVKAFIGKNKHLPEIPSETEVAKEGVMLGEMNRLLVKKIEEQTLYLIQISETLTRQQNQINKQQKQISRLIKQSKPSVKSVKQVLR